ncbi:hypothetical protein GCM10008959_32310 [Deinococcus seoulensis]|nr:MULTISPECIES: hypothetical protein [Deinococcus]GGR67712.1 hypothetical protein GCM10008959_32310 [Deinococcus seoulensis]
MKKFLAIAAFLMLGNAIAAERVSVCAKYRTNSGWSKGYKVDAVLYKGTELNQATKSFDYSAFSSYVVIFWSKTNASIIEMDFPWLSVIGSSGKERDGTKWEISKSTTLCY